MVLPVAFLLDFLGMFLIGLCAFWLESTSGLALIYSRAVMMFGGMFLPLEIYPDALQPVLRMLPFASMISAPGGMFVNPSFGLLKESMITQGAAVVAYAGLVSAVQLIAIAPSVREREVDMCRSFVDYMRLCGVFAHQPECPAGVSWSVLFRSDCDVHQQRSVGVVLGVFLYPLSGAARLELQRRDVVVGNNGGRLWHRLCVMGNAHRQSGFGDNEWRTGHVASASSRRVAASFAWQNHTQRVG